MAIVRVTFGLKNAIVAHFNRGGTQEGKKWIKRPWLFSIMAYLHWPSYDIMAICPYTIVEYTTNLLQGL